MEAKDIFIDRYNTEPLVVRAPGRINLLGEHTDYYEGIVLPAAITFGITVAAATHPAIIRLYSKQYDEEFLIEPENFQPVTGHWSSYVLGLYDQLTRRGHILGGFSMVIDGDIPAGAGLSAAL